MDAKTKFIDDYCGSDAAVHDCVAGKDLLSKKDGGEPLYASGAYAGVPSRENIRAVVASSIWVISEDAFRNLQETNPAFKNYYIGILNGRFAA